MDDPFAGLFAPEQSASQFASWGGSAPAEPAPTSGFSFVISPPAPASSPPFAPPPKQPGVPSMSAAQLRSFLAARGVSTVGLSEKSEFVALAYAEVARDEAARAAPPPRPEPAAPASRGAATALELGLGNAFETAGFAGIASTAAVTSLRHELEYRAATSGSAASAAAASGGSLVAFGNTAPPLHAIVVPPLPPPRLRALVRVPRACLDPIVRELPASYLLEAASELSMAQASRRTALLPHVGAAQLGPRRVFELPLRDDVPSSAVLAAAASAGRVIGLEPSLQTQSPTHAQQSCLLQQRCVVPASDFAAIAGFSSAQVKIDVRSPPSAPQTAGGFALFASQATYVLSIGCFVGAASDSRSCADTVGERSLFLHLARFPLNAAANASSFGPVRTRTSADSAASTAAAAAESLGLSDLAPSRGGRGIVCRLVHRRAAAARADGGPGLAPPAPAAADDLFGLSTSLPSAAARDDDEASGGDGDGDGDLSAEYRLLRSQHVSRAALVLASAGPGVSEPADAAPNEFEVAAEDGGSDSAAPGDDDGEWAAVRVSFLQPEFVGAAAPASTSATTAFGLPRVQCELASTACALAAALRPMGVLRESLFADAIASARASLARSRGEALPPPLADRDWGSPRFVVHADATACVAQAYRAVGERLLLAAARPYELVAKADEGRFAAVARTLRPMAEALREPLVGISAAQTPVGATSASTGAAAARASAGSLAAAAAAAVVPLPSLSLAEYGAEEPSPSIGEDEVERGSLSASSVSDGGLTATEAVARRVYALALATLRRLDSAAAALAAVQCAAVAREMRARLLRKRHHTGLRRGCSLLLASDLVVRLLAAARHAALLAAATAALTGAGAATDAAAAARALLASLSVAPHAGATGSLADDEAEAALLVCRASWAWGNDSGGGISGSGELAVTAKQLVLVPSVLGFRALTSAPPVRLGLDRLVSVREGPGSDVTLLLLDAHTPATSTAAKAAAPATTASLLDSDLDALTISSHPASRIASAGAVADAFSGLGGSAADSTSTTLAMPVLLEPAPSRAAAPLAAAPPAAASTWERQQLAALSDVDRLTLLSSASAPLRELRISLGAGGDSAALRQLLLLLRQMRARPHQLAFDDDADTLPDGAAAQGVSARALARARAQAQAADFFEALEVEGRSLRPCKRPSLAAAASFGSGAAAAARPHTQAPASTAAASGLDDLFAPAPTRAAAAASAPALVAVPAAPASVSAFFSGLGLGLGAAQPRPHAAAGAADAAPAPTTDEYASELGGLGDL